MWEYHPIRSVATTNSRPSTTSPVALASDEDKATSEAYGVWVEKSMYGKKYMGVERATFLIHKDGNIARAWRKVKVPGHAEAVLEAAQSLG